MYVVVGFDLGEKFQVVGKHLLSSIRLVNGYVGCSVAFVVIYRDLLSVEQTGPILISWLEQGRRFRQWRPFQVKHEERHPHNTYSESLFHVISFFQYIFQFFNMLKKFTNFCIASLHSKMQQFCSFLHAAEQDAGSWIFFETLN